MDEDREEVLYWDGDDDPEAAGWYIVVVDGQTGLNDMIAGPYDTKEEADFYHDITNVEADDYWTGLEHPKAA